MLQIFWGTKTVVDIVRHVDEEDRLKERIVLSGQNREVILINESGFYSLILRSEMPKAKQFKRWVTAEVLPQIRKTGGYSPNNQLALSEFKVQVIAMVNDIVSEKINEVEMECTPYE